MKINYKKINCEVCYIINETLIGDEEIKDSDDFLFCDECEKDLPFYYALKNNDKRAIRELKKSFTYLR